MPLLSSTRKAEEFARLLEGSGDAGSSSQLGTLQNLATRLSSVPQPRPEFASALRDKLMAEAASTLPSAAGGAAGGAGTGAGTGGTASGSAAHGAASSGSAAVSSATATGGTAAGGSAAAGSAVSAVLGATAPVWAQFGAIVAATTIALGGVGLGASKSLPGDPLYGVKRQIEQIQLDLAGGRTDTALAQLGLAHTRLQEIADLLAGRNADAPLSADLQKRVSQLLSDWAAETSNGTTVLLDQLSAATGNLSTIRLKLTDFTSSQARELALVVQQLPDQRLQSLTGSAFAYLQRVDTALGNPVNLATLLPSLGLPLPTSAQGATPSTSTPGTKTPSTSTSTAPKANTPSSVPTLPIPANGTTGTTPNTRTPTVPTVPTVGGNPVPVPSLGGTVGNTVNGVGKTVNGVLNGVTGKGPGLVLPTSVPSVPAVGH